MNINKLKSITQAIKKDIPLLVKPEVPLLSIAQTIEDKIVSMGARPAFPVNLSINDIAAHYTPSVEDTTIVRDKDVLKVDFGVELDGSITDTALTLDFSGENGKLVEAAEAALEEASSIIRPGRTVAEISKAIESKIKSYGFKPIANLTGHRIEGLTLHGHVAIPNVAVKDNYIFKEGDVFAIEPFVTTANGAGHVVDLDTVEIYSYFRDAGLRLRESRILLDHIKQAYGPLPFAERWIAKKVPSKLLLLASLKELLKTHAIQAYPALREANRAIVSQAEKTVLLTKDGAEPLV
jgi:methionyl aminopeptidase